ncbi:hypothetical protein EYF80_046028 [Liparis tanakae]|uniref:Uncharacterized protein n=1 Tax=Liparis tanakae TaxID=230148 RepID=A0A4Z2FS15_9TELE|nr:hypothetical protein EYF80_046028 [Liparis tanakae]
MSATTCSFICITYTGRRASQWPGFLASIRTRAWQGISTVSMVSTAWKQTHQRIDPRLILSKSDRKGFTAFSPTIFRAVPNASKAASLTSGAESFTC